MCRLLLANKAALQTLTDEVLTAWLTDLEASYGGHGNGVGILTDKKHVIVAKGVDMTVDESVKLIRSYDAEWVIWHTRLASSMTIDDQYCHPFQYGNLTLAHNGHNGNWAKAGLPYNYSDTQALAVAASHEGKLRLIRKASGVFIGFEKGEPFVIKKQSYSDLVMWEDYNDFGHALVFASEPTYAVQDNCVNVGNADWTTGEPTEDTLNATMSFYKYTAPTYGTYKNSKGELVTYKKSVGTSYYGYNDYEKDYDDYNQWWTKDVDKDAGKLPSTTPDPKKEEYWGMSIVDRESGEVIGEIAEDGTRLYYGDAVDETAPVSTVEAHQWDPGKDDYVSVGGVIHKVLHLEDDTTVSVSLEDGHVDPIDAAATSRRELRRQRKEEKRRRRLEQVASHMNPTKQSWEESRLAEAVQTEAPALSIVNLPDNYNEFTDEMRTAWWLTRFNTQKAQYTQPKIAVAEATTEVDGRVM